MEKGKPIPNKDEFESFIHNKTVDWKPNVAFKRKIEVHDFNPDQNDDLQENQCQNADLSQINSKKKNIDHFEKDNISAVANTMLVKLFKF